MTFVCLPPALTPYAAQTRLGDWRKETTKKGRPTKVPYRAQPPDKAEGNDPARGRRSTRR